MKRYRAIIRSSFALALAFLTIVMPLEGMWPAYLNTPDALAVGGYEAVALYGPTYYDTPVHWNEVATLGSEIISFVYDSSGAILYGLAYDGAVYYCDITTGCDDDLNWDSYTVTTPMGTGFKGLDIAGDYLFGGSNGAYNTSPGNAVANIYRCTLSSYCDESTDWSLMAETDDIGSATLTVVDFATTGGVVYAAGEGGYVDIDPFGTDFRLLSGGTTIYRCLLSSGCDDFSEWAVVDGPDGNTAMTIEADDASHTLFVGEKWHDDGTIRVCDQDVAGCDDTSEWEDAVLPSGTYGPIEFAVDTDNDVIYAMTYGTGQDGPPDHASVIRCVISSGCDDNGDWTLSIDLSALSEDVEAYGISWDGVNGYLHATLFDGDVDVIIRCDIAGTDCDESTDWHTVNYGYGGALFHDPGLGVVYVSSGATIVQCTEGGDCKDTEFEAPRGVAVDDVNDRLFVADPNRNRVLVYDAATVSNGEEPAFVLGQSDFISTVANAPDGTPSDTNMSSPYDVAYESENELLYVADSGNNRVLVFDVSALGTGDAALKVLGQSGFSGSECNRGTGTDANTLCDPKSVTVDPLNEWLYVSDTGNYRVLTYGVPGGLAGITNGEAAVDVYGQAGEDFTTSNFGDSTSEFGEPRGIFVETTSDHLWVTDYINNRVMGFSPGVDSAEVIYGSDNSSCNSGGAPTASSMCYPEDVSYMELDGSDQRLLVADSGNNRVLLFNTSGVLVDGDDAVDLFGQTDFVSDGTDASSAGLSAPRGLEYDEINSRIWMSDDGNDRIIMNGPPPPAGPETPGDGEITGICTGWPSPHVEIAWSENPPPGSDPPNSNSILRGVDSQGNEWFFGGPDFIDGTHIDNTPATAGDFDDYDLRDDSVSVGHTYHYTVKYRPETPSSNTYTVTINAESCGGTPDPTLGGHLGTNNDFLTSSAPSEPSDHTIQFVTGGYIPNGSYIVYTFDDAFDMSAITIDDVIFYYNEQDPFTIDGDCSGADVAAEFIDNTIVMTLCPGGVAELNQYSLVILYVGGSNQIINPPNVGTYGIRIAAYDENDVLLAEDDPFVAIVNPVDLNAYVAPSFTFIIDGVSGSEAIDGLTVSSASSALYVGFGTLTAGTPVTMGSSLSVSTNAASGFTVTVQENHNLLASSGADIDSFSNGTVQYPAATWTAPTGTLGSETTYGHLAVTTEDDATISKTASVTTSTDGEWIGLTPGTPRSIWSNSGPSDGVTQDVGHIDVGYRVQITALQEAGRYQNRLMYIATPVF